MNREVFLSILAMDSYQRGYSPGIKGVDRNVAGQPITKIGTANILQDSTQYAVTADGDKVGFFASAYTLDSSYAGIDAGTTILSFRGTDLDFGHGSQFTRDFIYGWSSFTGLWKTSQFALAQQFYKAVTSSDFPVGNQTPVPNIITTGHSLGGALAGLVAANDNAEPLRKRLAA